MTAQCIDSLHVASTCVAAKAALWFQKNHPSSVLIEFSTEVALTHGLNLCCLCWGMKYQGEEYLSCARSE